jgi:hypothetical protein
MHLTHKFSNLGGLVPGACRKSIAKPGGQGCSGPTIHPMHLIQCFRSMHGSFARAVRKGQVGWYVPAQPASPACQPTPSTPHPVVEKAPGLGSVAASRTFNLERITIAKRLLLFEAFSVDRSVAPLCHRIISWSDSRSKRREQTIAFLARLSRLCNRSSSLVSSFGRSTRQPRLFSPLSCPKIWSIPRILHINDVSLSRSGAAQRQNALFSRGVIFRQSLHLQEPGAIFNCGW